MRCPGASGVGRLGEEEERDEAELVGVSERLGDGCGREGSEGQRRWRSAGCVREGQRRGEAMGEVEGVPGGCVARMEASRALGTQAARQEVARARVHARRARALPIGLGRKTTGEVEVGWASELGWLQGRAM